MAEGWSTAAGNDALDTLVAAYPFIQLHTGAPGAAGTANVATETDRQDSTGDWAAASAGSVTTDAALTWSDVAAAEDYTHFSAWTLTAAGSFGYSGTITANAVGVGDTFTIGAGDFTVSVTVAS